MGPLLSKTFLLAVPVAALAVLSLAPATAIAPVQPGQVAFSSTGQCTFNFVYDGGGKTYIGLAAHCVSGLGDAVYTCQGDPVLFGSVSSGCGTRNAFVGTVAKFGNPGSARDDWALVEVAPSALPAVSPAVRGHPDMPTGVATSATAGRGHPLQHSGFGLGFQQTPVTQQHRVGVLTFFDDSGGATGVYRCECPIIFGDSGGPVVDLLDGRAVGIVSRIIYGSCCSPGGYVAYDEAPTVQRIEQVAGVTLRTV